MQIKTSSPGDITYNVIAKKIPKGYLEFKIPYFSYLKTGKKGIQAFVDYLLKETNSFANECQIRYEKSPFNNEENIIIVDYTLTKTQCGKIVKYFEENADKFLISKYQIKDSTTFELPTVNPNNSMTFYEILQDVVEYDDSYLKSLKNRLRYLHPIEAYFNPEIEEGIRNAIKVELERKKNYELINKFTRTKIF